MLLNPAVDCIHDKMAEMLAIHPTYKNICNVLNKTPKKKLLSLQDKLNSMRSSTKYVKLLQAMILNTLGQDDEAQVALTTLDTDQVAPHISNKIQHSEWHQNYGSNSVAPHQNPDVLITVARIYTLLVKENLCAESARNRAYQVAIEASKSGDKFSLQNLLSESLQACGVHSFNSTGFNEPLTLKSIPNVTAPTSPLSIPSNRRRNEGCAPTALGSLHSFSNMASFSSNLEISQSPTAEFLSRPTQCSNNHIEPSKLCQDNIHGPVQHRVGEDDLGVQNANEEDEAVQEPSMPTTHNSQESEVSCSYPSTGPGSETSVPQTSYCFPIECTDPSSTSQHVMLTDEPENGSGQRTDVTSVGVSSSTEIAQSSPSSTVPPADNNSTLQHNIDSKPISSATPLLTETVDSESTFFSFVVLHAKGDEAIAIKVRDTLKNFGIPDGTTYCEEFEMPGYSPLTCIEDAVDNSAFTILLLTSHFVSRWARLQTNTVLMNSINKKHKFNSVIPFLPKEDPLKEIPMVLNSIVPLNEKLPTFLRTARKTFNPYRIQQMKENWKQEQAVRELKRRNKITEKQVIYNQQIKDATLALSSQHLKLLQTMYNTPTFHLPGPQQPFQPGMPQIPGTASGFPLDCSQIFPSLGPVPPPMAHMPYQLNGMPFQHFSDAQGTQYASGGTQPVIQIQHARNVQIGDHNQMRIVETEEERDSLDGVDSESDCVS
ncbi:TIR domain-containing adapter molecule 1 [Microcaecilia unicolor]|uniref:TIR domain-containing adapter molecule 1 n=1 Tax=Microcaecilia unicolor TaxID=1415580 RepID=A0A6P7ZDW7_9AMPH|nr:TIR domain-containing adapter molecule 1 [Microcaecilia unicolor]XP_030073779.1 TIR domain-containing adapter molecule 1 [Microcaecilia unicolor]